MRALAVWKFWAVVARARRDWPSGASAKPARLGEKDELG